jgi:aspartate kinase
MKIFKFGGASISNAERIINMGDILIDYKSEKLVLVISALGKTTNALEEVAFHFCANNQMEARKLFEKLETQHNALAIELLQEKSEICLVALSKIYAEADWILNENPVRHADYYYDQLICLGEMMSTTIVHHYLESIQINSVWMDVRDVLKTDETFKEAIVDLENSKINICKTVHSLFAKHNFIITQGFVGSTSLNDSTTLGREGSDYTGALFASMLGAESLTIWKDVKGLLNGDPKIFTDLVEIKKISYHEVVEMAFYGAQVIHAKTIKPLQNNNIPLYVKCFLDKNFEGTTIQNEVDKKNYPPILVKKANQVLIQITSKDFSFITDDKLSEIYDVFHSVNAHINIMQTAAISLVASIDYNKEKLDKLYAAFSTDYNILRNEKIELLTIRHHNPDVIEKYSAGKLILLEQKTRHTLQMLMK